MTDSDRGGLPDRLLYTYADVDRILGLAFGTARRWLNGYERAGQFYLPVVRQKPTDRHLVSWGEFIEVYYLSRFRGSGLPLQKLRRILEEIRQRTYVHYLFSHDHVLLADPERLEILEEIEIAVGLPGFLIKRTGQLELDLHPEARRRLERITYEEGIAHALLPRLGIDTIRVRADEFFGKPKIIGTGISPHAVADAVKWGSTVDAAAATFHLPARQVIDAGRFVFGDKKWRRYAPAA